jgi:hypothetical protein
MAAVNAVHAHMNQRCMARRRASTRCSSARTRPKTVRLPQAPARADAATSPPLRRRPAQVPMVGDTLRDLQAAQAAGCEPHLVRTGRAAGLGRAELRRIRPGARRAGARRPGAFADHLLRARPAARPGPLGAHGRRKALTWRRCARRCSCSWMAVTVMPWALAGAVVAVRAGHALYWLCAGWLRTAIWGAKRDLRRALPRARAWSTCPPPPTGRRPCCWRPSTSRPGRPSPSRR